MGRISSCTVGCPICDVPILVPIAASFPPVRLVGSCAVRVTLSPDMTPVYEHLATHPDPPSPGLPSPLPCAI